MNEVCFQLFVYGFIFSLKGWAYLKYERLVLYSNDRLVGFSNPSLSLFQIKLIDKMSLGVGAQKVEGPIAQKLSIALEVTMATKQTPTTRHRHTERIQWNTYQNPYLPIRG